MKTKICTKCNLEKPLSEFYKSGKYYNSQCKECKIKQNVNYAKNNEKIKSYHKKYRIENKKQIKEKQREYYCKNINDIKEYHKNYYQENKNKIAKYREDNKEQIKKRQKNYYKNNYEEINKKHKDWLLKNKIQQREYEKERLKNDNNFKLKKQIRNMIRQSFLRKGIKKEYKCEKILCCDITTFKNYLLQTFKNNYGYEWNGKESVHIDHIIPLDTANNEEEIIELCHYTNLQLLKEKDNIRKRDIINWNINAKE